MAIRRMKKKALAFDMIVFLVFFLMASGNLITDISLERSKVMQKQEFLGSYALQMIFKEQDLQKTMIYNDIIVQRAIYQSIFNLSQSGGFYAKSNCGDFNGYNLWKTNSKQCFPKVEQSYIDYLNSNLNSYLLNSDYFFKNDNYHYSILQYENYSKIIGMALNSYDPKNPKKLDFVKSEESNQDLIKTNKCNEVTTLAKKYVGVQASKAYSNSKKILTPYQANYFGIDNSNFVDSVFNISMDVSIGGIPIRKCKNKNMKEVKKEELLPGDIFIVETQDNQNGHTGIYVGNGIVKDDFKKFQNKHSDFIPKDGGKEIFIHGPNIGYNTYDELFENKNPSFCRLEQCD